jgi:hypothetical protein
MGEPSAAEHDLPDRRERTGAVVAAGAAWSGLGLQAAATVAFTGDAVISALAMARYFTVLANLAFALTMTAIAFGRRPSAAWVGGVTLCMVTVGAVYAILLNGFLVLPGLGSAASLALHRIAPCAAGLFWLLLAPKGGLRRGDAVRWLGVLTLYAAYAAVRGTAEGAAVYPFLDPRAQGWIAVIITNLIIGAVFLLSGLGLVALDRRLGRRRG